MRCKYDLPYKEGLYIDLFLPECDKFDLFVYFHGGGLVELNRKNVEVFAKTLAKNGIATASVEYRMYPNAVFPDFIDDCAESLAWLKNNIAKYGECKKIYAGGSSAGGYLSMMLCFDDRYLAKVGMKPTDIAGYVHDAGQPTAHFNVLTYSGTDGKRVIVDERAPMYFVGMAEKYSPMVFVVSDNDMFGRLEQTMLMVKTLNHFGHTDNVFLDIKHGGHCEYVYKADEDGEGQFGKIVLDFINKLK